MLTRITQRLLHQHFVYEDDGRLRKVLNARKPYPWRAIGYQGRYLACTFLGETIYLHRAVFLYRHGVLPATIDHADGDTTNNRIENLRACTPAQNQYNALKKSNNRSGFKGVAFCRGYRHPWRARIVVDRQVICLGYFASAAEAGDAYAQGAKRYARSFARSEILDLI
jgi:hypothetical protein